LALDKEKYQAYISILKEELVPALGCTEPIAIAYAAARAREVLGSFPDKVIVRCSGNIIKNAKSVIVPNTGNLKGIIASALAGILVGDSTKEMSLLEELTESDIAKIKELMQTDICRVEMLKSDANLHIVIQVMYADNEASVEIKHTHTNITRIEKDGKLIFQKKCKGENLNGFSTDRSTLNVRDIFDFANTVKLEDIVDLLKGQIEYNLSIAREGINGNYGCGVGKMLIECYGDNTFTKIRAYAAAGSDARMNGCNLPVVTNSGSGNQGMTTSLPVIIYAQEKKIDQEKMYRGLVLSNLITIHLRSAMGRLSAYCGAVCAACGSGAGITYLAGGTLKQIERTITNTLGNVSGIVCDGAKSSCAAKIASGLDAAIMAHFLAMRGTAFETNSGIIKETVEDTIAAVGRLGHDGMKATDVEVLKIMLGQ